MSYIIRPALLSEAETVQSIINEKKNIFWTGGFTYLEAIKKKINIRVPGYFVCETSKGKIVGCGGIDARTREFLTRFCTLSVLPEYQRKGISRALDVVRIFQGLMEGRRLFETIVMEGNEKRCGGLEHLGFKQTGTFPHITGTAKSLHYYHYSMLWDRNTLNNIISNIPNGFEYEMHISEETKKMLEINMKSYIKNKINYDFLAVADAISDRIVKIPSITIVEITPSLRKLL